MSRWKVRTGLLILFISGILVGGSGTLLITKNFLSGSVSQGPASNRSKLTRVLSWYLELDPVQQEMAELSIALMQRDVYAIRLQHQHELSRIFDQAVTALLPALNAKQEQKLKGLRDRFSLSLERWPEWQKETEHYLTSRGIALSNNTDATRK